MENAHGRVKITDFEIVSGSRQNDKGGNGLRGILIGIEKCQKVKPIAMIDRSRTRALFQQKKDSDVED